MVAPMRVAIPRWMAVGSIDVFIAIVLLDFALFFAAGGPEQEMLPAAPAIALLIRQFEERYVKSCSAGAGSPRSARFCSPAGKSGRLPSVLRFRSLSMRSVLIACCHASNQWNAI